MLNSYNLTNNNALCFAWQNRKVLDNRYIKFKLLGVERKEKVNITRSVTSKPGEEMWYYKRTIIQDKWVLH